MGVVVPLDKNINKIDNMWHFNATPALFKHVPRQPSLRLIYMLCFMYASRTVWNFALPQTEYAEEKLTFLLPLSLPFFLSSNLTTFIFPSYYLPFLISIFMALFSIHIYSSPPFFSISVFCFPYLPTNIAVTWLSFQLHLPSSNLDGSLSWVKEFCGHFHVSPLQMLWYWPQHALIINRLTIMYNRKCFLVIKCNKSNLKIMR